MFPGKGPSICFSFTVSPAGSHNSWARGRTAMAVACLAVDPLPVLPVALPSTACGHPDGAVRDPNCRAQGAGAHTAAAGQTAWTVMRGWAARARREGMWVSVAQAQVSGQDECNGGTAGPSCHPRPQHAPLSCSSRRVSCRVSSCFRRRWASSWASATPGTHSAGSKDSSTQTAHTQPG